MQNTPKDNPLSYNLTSSTLKLVRFPVLDKYNNTKSTIITGDGTESRTVILGSIMQFYAGILQDRNGLATQRMVWCYQLVAQDAVTKEFIWLRQSPQLGYGGQIPFIYEDYIYFLIETAPEKTPILGSVSTEVGEELFEMYRKGDVHDISLDARYKEEQARVLSEMNKKIITSQIQPTSVITNPSIQ